MSESHNDSYKLTFSQREGINPLPESMRLKHIPKKFKQVVWKAISSEIDETEVYRGTYRFASYPNIGTILYDYEFEVLIKFHNDIESYQDSHKCDSFFYKLICEDSDDNNYHKILTVLEFMLRHDACPECLYKSLVDAFNETPIAYFVEKIGGLPTIVPRISHEAGEATRQAIKVIRQGVQGGASTHLRQAAEHINTEQYADAVADSISAVESVARQIAPEAKGLGQALKVLEKKGVIINQQLKAGFEKLYAYSNSEEGIRHALLNKDSSDAGLDEAMFMFGACASFAAYLVSKYRQTEH